MQALKATVSFLDGSKTARMGRCLTRVYAVRIQHPFFAPHSAGFSKVPITTTKMNGLQRNLGKNLRSKGL